MNYTGTGLYYMICKIKYINLACARPARKPDKDRRGCAVPDKGQGKDGNVDMNVSYKELREQER